jgi:predicted acetyltransferase
VTEFRPIPETRRDAFRSLLRYAFAPERGPEVDPDGEWPPALGEPRGLFDGDVLVGVCKLYVLDAYVHGDQRQIGGLGAVATPPEHRGEGYGRALCRHAVGEFRERGVDTVTLWPFETAFYRRLGWATANNYTEYVLPPDTLPEFETAGEIYRLNADDWERLRRVERAFSAETTLSVRRSERWWRERTLAGWPGGTTPYVYGHERDGDLRGYVVYTVDREDGRRRLTVTDLAHADRTSYRALLDFLGGHGAQVEEILLRRRAETDLLDVVAEPEAVDCVVKPGPMARLTQLGALDRLDWPDETRVTLAVTDPLEASGGRVRVVHEGDTTRTECVSGDAGQADAETDVGTLSGLFLGTHGVEWAVERDRLAIHESAVRESLAAAFESRPVCLREFF